MHNRQGQLKYEHAVYFLLKCSHCGSYESAGSGGSGSTNGGKRFANARPGKCSAQLFSLVARSDPSAAWRFKALTFSSGVMATPSKNINSWSRSSTYIGRGNC